MHEADWRPTDQQPIRYRLSGNMCWRDLDGEWVVYSETPSQVCHLDRFGATVLAIIEASPVTLAEIVSEIQSELQEQDLVTPEMMLDDPLTERMQSCLGRLTAAGLIAQGGA